MRRPRARPTIDIISIAQHASPKAAGKNEFERAHATALSSVVVITRFFDVAFEVGALEVGGGVGALEVSTAQHLARVQPAHAQILGVPGTPGGRRPAADGLALHLHSSAPLRHTYTKATNSSRMNTIVSTSAKLPYARSSTAIGYRKITSMSNRMNSIAIR